MKKYFLSIIIAFLFLMQSGCTFLKVNVGDEIEPFSEKVVSGEGRDKVLLLDLSGVIMSGDGEPVLGGRKKPGLVARMREALDRARQDEHVKAVVLRINSPGGGVTASDTLYHELRKFKEETGVKIVAHITDVGASGAYYVALAADAITAQPTSVTGSIGVIMYSVDITGLMQKIGVRTVEIASAEKKGLGSPFKALSADERKIFQDFIDSLYGRFTGLIVEGRKMSPEAVRKMADGRIFTSAEAKAGGLIDGVGYLEDAIELAKKQANLPQARVVTYFRPGEYKANIYSMSLIDLDLGDLADPGAKFLYLWWP